MHSYIKFLNTNLVLHGKKTKVHPILLIMSWTYIYDKNYFPSLIIHTMKITMTTMTIMIIMITITMNLVCPSTSPTLSMKTVMITATTPNQTVTSLAGNTGSRCPTDALRSWDIQPIGKTDLMPRYLFNNLSIFRWKLLELVSAIERILSDI